MTDDSLTLSQTQEVWGSKRHKTYEVQNHADGSENQIRHITPGNTQSLAQGIFEHRADNHGQDKRGRLKSQALQEKTGEPEKTHHQQVDGTLIYAVDANQTEDNDNGQED